MSNGLYPPAKRNRRIRIKKLETAIKNKNDNETYEEVIAKFILNEGTSIRKVREYLKILKLAGRINEEIGI